MKIGYARVSTGEQNLDLQVDALKQAGCEDIFCDEGVSGLQKNRSGLDQALARLNNGDILVVWKLDRLGRSLSFLIALVSGFEREDIHLRSLQDGIDTTTSSGKLVFHIMAVLAEFERELISERTKAGMMAAKNRGRSIGRPKVLSLEQILHARSMISSGEKTVVEMARIFNVHRTTLSRSLGSC